MVVLLEPPHMLPQYKEFRLQFTTWLRPWPGSILTIVTIVTNDTTDERSDKRPSDARSDTVGWFARRGAHFIAALARAVRLGTFADRLRWFDDPRLPPVPHLGGRRERQAVVLGRGAVSDRFLDVRPTESRRRRHGLSRFVD